MSNPADLPLLDAFVLPVSGGHELAVAEYGHPQGRPALVIHGGPGSGASPALRRGFDPQRWRVICIDQRGAGRSRPRGSVTHNRTDLLVDDLLALRERLRLPGWLVCGGSWGATLALAYAAADPQAVQGLLLRATFLGRDEDIEAFFTGSPGLALEPLARDLLEGDRDTRAAAARAWWRWEQQLATGRTDAPTLEGEALAFQVDRLRVQAHYFRHGCWLRERPLLDRCAEVPRVPTLLLHARDDRVCPPAGAALVHERLPHARLHWIAEGGHDATHPALVAATTAALARFADHGDFGA